MSQTLSLSKLSSMMALRSCKIWQHFKVSNTAALQVSDMVTLQGHKNGRIQSFKYGYVLRHPSMTAPHSLRCLYGHTPKVKIWRHCKVPDMIALKSVKHGYQFKASNMAPVQNSKYGYTVKVSNRVINSKFQIWSHIRIQNMVALKRIQKYGCTLEVSKIVDLRYASA